MVKKTKYAAGIEIESAFGRTDYMYVYEVAPWAYDAINDWIKVSIESALPFDLSDDWARELGQVDLARYAGAAVGLLNPVHVGVTVAGAIVDPRAIRALTAADIVSAAQSGVWSVGRTWTLTALDIVSAAQSGVWSVGRTWALAVATDSVVAQVSNWPALYAANLTQYLSAACGLLNPVHVGVTVAGAIVDPRQIRALDSGDVPGRDWTLGGSDVPISRWESYLDLGNAFWANCYSLAIANNATCYPCRINNPVASGKTLVLVGMWIYATVFAGYLDCAIKRSSTYTGAGTAVTPETLHIGSGQAPVVNVYRDPTINVAGTSVFVALVPYLRFGYVQIDLELNPNQDLLVMVTNKTGAQADIGVKPVWYEK